MLLPVSVTYAVYIHSLQADEREDSPPSLKKAKVEEVETKSVPVSAVLCVIPQCVFLNEVL